MSQNPMDEMSQECLPRWAELPDLELYMDQVLSVVERCRLNMPGAGEKELTKSMINNYVKMGVMPPPVKKRYARPHLAALIMICALKNVLPIPAVRDLLQRAREQAAPDRVYDAFCEALEESGRQARALREAEDGLDPVDRALRTALRARAFQRSALDLCLCPGEDRAQYACAATRRESES